MNNNNDFPANNNADANNTGNQLNEHPKVKQVDQVIQTSDNTTTFRSKLNKRIELNSHNNSKYSLSPQKFKQTSVENDNIKVDDFCNNDLKFVIPPYGGKGQMGGGGGENQQKESLPKLYEATAKNIVDIRIPLDDKHI